MDLDMKALHVSLFFVLLLFQFTQCVADANEFNLVSKNYQSISINDPESINSQGLFFPPNVIQVDEKNNLSYHLIDTNKIAIKEHINGALVDIIEVPIKQSKYELPSEVRPAITSLTLDTKRNQLWISTFQDFNYLLDLKKRTFKKLVIEGLYDSYGMEAGFYDQESDSTYIVYMGEVGPKLLQVSNNKLTKKYIPSHNLTGFTGIDEIYSILKLGGELLVWEGAYNAEKLWTINTNETSNDGVINPIYFQPPKILTNKIDSRLWWGLLPRAPYSQGNKKDIVTLTVNNAKICDNFTNEVSENYVSSKHLFDSYRQNSFGLNKFYYTKYSQNPIRHIYEQEIDGSPYYITRRTISGCGSRCDTQFTAVTPVPLGKTWEYLKANPDQPKPTPYGQHNLATDDDGQLYYVSFNSNHYNLHKFNKGKWGLSCQVEINPSGNLTNSNNKANELKKQLGDNLKELSLSVHTMIGESGKGFGCKGAYRTNYVRQKSFNEIFEVISSRPHQFTSIKNYPEVLIALKNWSYGGLYQYQTFKGYQNLFDKSLDQLSQYYQLQFKLKPNEAKIKAEYALKSAVSTDINTFTDKYLHYTLELRKSILEKQPIETIKAEITQSAHAEPDSILNLAVVYPEALKILIKEGFDVNQRNTFGKTPLMYAAQYNQYESIALLLAAQADPNLMIHQPKDNECEYSLETTNLSSLHYAVRFADFKSIKILIDSGAWLELKALENSRNYTSTALDWLTKHRDENINLSEEEFEKLQILLSPKKGKELRHFTKKLTVKAESDYRNGKLGLAYKSLKLITSADPEYIRALSDFSLVALKTKDFETALDVNERILRLSKKDSERASAFFNIGLTCEKIPERSDIDYFKREKCRKGLLPNFLEALLLKQTKSRKNKVHELIRNTEDFCTIEDNENFSIKLNVENESSSSFSFIVAYIKKNNSEVPPLDFSERLNLPKKIVKRKKEVDMIRKETYQDESLYIEKVMLGTNIGTDKLRTLCQ